MGEIVPYGKQGAGGSDSRALTLVGPSTAAGTYEERIQQANELEAKLKYINETVPTKVYNVSSSSAGAGSGDFHQYRIVRRAEQDRVRQMEAHFAKKQQDDEFMKRVEELKKQAEDKTAKKRAKRQKKKAKKKAKGAGGDKAGEGAEGSGSDSDDEDGTVQPALD